MSTGSSPRVRQLWLLPVLLIAVIATALGGLLARDLYADPDPQTPAPVLPTQSSIPPSAQPGPATVEGTVDAVAHPLHETVRTLLQTYFDAINTKDYAAWSRTVTRERQEDASEKKWLNDYQTTRDGSIVIYRIEMAAQDTARVLMTFTSTQDIQDAPQELPVDCIHWNVVFALTVERGDWKLASGPTSASPQHEEC